MWEETGIDVRNQLDRLQPAALRDSDTATELSCEIKKRLFYFLAITDEDFLSAETTSERLVGPLGTEGRHLQIKYSIEHSGFDFENDPNVSVQKLKKHSGGIPSQALSMSMARDAHKSQDPYQSPSRAADQGVDHYSDDGEGPPDEKDEKGCFSLFC